jgi:ATP-dependent protease ClpP protease subunit
MEGDNMSNKKDYVYGTPVATEYRYYLDDSVSDPQDYHELFELLANAGENDLVRIIISNFGGSLVTCIAIVNAIRSTKAMTMGVLASVAYSAGGAIWLACEGQEVQQHVGFMAHDAQGGSFGSLFQQKQSIEHEMEILRSLYLDVYEGFLSEEEIELVLKNGDMRLSEKEICSRLDKRVKLFESRQKQAIKDMEDMFSGGEQIPDWVFNHKLMTKAKLISLFKGEVDIAIDEQNKTFELIPVDLPEIA